MWLEFFSIYYIYIYRFLNICFLLNLCSETLEEYVTKINEVIGELLKGISLSLGLEENYIHKSMNIESGSQLLVINYYPPCPKPELVMGLPAHTDHGLLTILIQNEFGGLQIEHDGKWIPVNPLPNSFLINTGDHLEVNLSHICNQLILFSFILIISIVQVLLKIVLFG